MSELDADERAELARLRAQRELKRARERAREERLKGDEKRKQQNREKANRWRAKNIGYKKNRAKTEEYIAYQRRYYEEKREKINARRRARRKELREAKTNG